VAQKVSFLKNLGFADVFTTNHKKSVEQFLTFKYRFMCRQKLINSLTD